MTIGIIGLDIDKRVFEVHGEDAEGRVFVQKRARREGDGEHSSRSLRHAWWRSRLVARRIIGAARCGLWATSIG